MAYICPSTFATSTSSPPRFTFFIDPDGKSSFCPTLTKASLNSNASKLLHLLLVSRSYLTYSSTVLMFAWKQSNPQTIRIVAVANGTFSRQNRSSNRCWSWDRENDSGLVCPRGRTISTERYPKRRIGRYRENA